LEIYSIKKNIYNPLLTVQYSSFSLQTFLEYRHRKLFKEFQFSKNRQHD